MLLLPLWLSFYVIIQAGVWVIRSWSLHHTHGCAPTEDGMAVLTARSGKQCSDDLVRELLRVFSSREPTLRELRSYICQVFLNLIKYEN